MQIASDVTWHSYWRRSPLQEQARQGDRIEPGLDEVAALLRSRYAAAFILPQACPDATADAAFVACVLGLIRGAGGGALRLVAEWQDGRCPGGSRREILLMIGPQADAAKPEDFAGAARGIARKSGGYHVVLTPGSELAPMLRTLLQRGLLQV